MNRQATILFASTLIITLGCRVEQPAMPSHVVADVADPNEPTETMPGMPVDQADETAGATHDYDTVFLLDRVRENCTSSEWAIAVSPITWSTFTADFDQAGFTPLSATDVWKRWSSTPTAITMRANSVIKDEIDAAIAEAKPGSRPAERQFDLKGFRFVVSASNGNSVETTFVRISFMDAKYAN